jgi:hypothetical protein
MMRRLEDERANGFRKLAVVEWRRIRVAVDTRLVHNCINLVCRDTRTNGGGGEIEHFTCKLNTFV